MFKNVDFSKQRHANIPLLLSITVILISGFFFLRVSYAVLTLFYICFNEPWYCVPFGLCGMSVIRH